jgi:hypothetical protein
MNEERTPTDLDVLRITQEAAEEVLARQGPGDSLTSAARMIAIGAQQRFAAEFGPRCRHCGGPPRPEMYPDHHLWPWHSSSVAPAGQWRHHYCSEACAAHAEEHSTTDSRGMGR